MPNEQEHPRYEEIDGWRITPHELGPHPQAESCDEEPVCGHVYRIREAADFGSDVVRPEPTESNRTLGGSDV